MNRTALVCTSIAAVALLGTAAMVALAGPLDPPAGAVTSTLKTLTEVEPRTLINSINTPGDADSLFRITQPGSYYLARGITGVVGKHGIEIAVSGVTVDLNGFDLVGVAGMGSFDGVSATVFGLTDITVVNGSVRNWGDEGVDLGTSIAINCRVEGVLASGNSGSGITVGVGSTVSNCAAYDNTVNGIIASSGSAVSTCSASFNIGTGIVTTGSTVTNCSAFDNFASGISAGSDSTIAQCSTGNNTIDGIRATSRNSIRGNTCSNNGSGGDGAGIHTTGTDNRIEGNNCTGADRGIDVDLNGNIIIKNTCSGNINNWDIAVGNSLGPIVVAGTNATAILGQGPSPSTLGSTDPNANFSY